MDNKNTYIGVDASGSTNVDHMTVLWMGSELPPINVMTVLKKYKEAYSYINRKRIETFSNNILVATIDLPEDSWIIEMRAELLAAGAKNHSQFEWNPHITIRQTEEENDPCKVIIPSEFRLHSPYISIARQRIYG